MTMAKNVCAPVRKANDGLTGSLPLCRLRSIQALDLSAKEPAFPSAGAIHSQSRPIWVFVAVR